MTFVGGEVRLIFARTTNLGAPVVFALQLRVTHRLTSDLIHHITLPDDAQFSAVALAFLLESAVTYSFMASFDAFVSTIKRLDADLLTGGNFLQTTGSFPFQNVPDLDLSAVTSLVWL